MASSCHVRNSFAVILWLSALLVASGANLRCWQGFCSSTESTSVCQGHLFQNPEAPDYTDTNSDCVRYGFTCQSGDASCGNVGDRMTGFALVGADTAATMKSYSLMEGADLHSRIGTC